MQPSQSFESARPPPFKYGRYVCSNDQAALSRVAEMFSTSIVKSSRAIAAFDFVSSISDTSSEPLPALTPAIDTPMSSFATLNPSKLRLERLYTTPSLTPSKGGTGIEGNIFSKNSSAWSVAVERSSRRASSSVAAQLAVSKTESTSMDCIRCMTTLFVMPAFSAAATTSSIVLFPDFPSKASRIVSPFVSRSSPAAARVSSLSRSVTSSTSAPIDISPDIMRLTCERIVDAVSSAPSPPETDASIESSCFSISLPAFRASGCNNAAVPPSPLAKLAISSALRSKCDSRSTRVASILNRARSRYKLFCEMSEMSDSLACFVFRSAASWRPEILLRKSV